MEKNKVLLIEDHHKPTNTLSSILKKQGMDIIDSVSTDQSAIRLLHEQSFDLIIVDTKSNLKRNWLQLVQELRSIKRKPIFVLSNYPEELVNKNNSPGQNVEYEQLVNSSARSAEDGSPKMELSLKKEQEKDILKIENGHYSFFKDIIFIKNDLIYQRIKISELDWVEAKRAYCEVVTTKRRFLLSINLNTFSKLVKYPSISRVHRSFLVNVDKIDGFENSCLYIRDQSIPIGSKYREEFVKLFPFINKSGIVVN